MTLVSGSHWKPRKSPRKILGIHDDNRFLATGKTSTRSSMKTPMYVILLVLFYNTVRHLKIHDAIRVVGRSLVLIVKSPDQAALDVHDLETPGSHGPRQENGRAILTLHIQLYIFDLAWQTITPLSEF